MANQWFRMYAEFSTDPKVQMMSEAYQRRFIMVLCMRCSNGDVTLQDEEIAFQLRISNDEWAATKAVFVAKNLLTEANEPTAWDKRQYLSDSSAERVARHRAKKKQQCNVTETAPEADTEADTEKPKEETHASGSSTGGTQAGAVCARLKSECRIVDVSPSHPKLLALLEAGLTDDEIVAAGHEANAKGKGFAYAMAVAEGRRRDAANVKPLPSARTARNAPAAESFETRDYGTGGKL